METVSLWAWFACGWIVVGMIIIRIRLRLDKKNQKDFNDTTKGLSYGMSRMLLFFGYVGWPYCIYDVLRRWNRRRTIRRMEKNIEKMEEVAKRIEEKLNGENKDEDN